jgi:hypothetical protein
LTRIANLIDPTTRCLKMAAKAYLRSGALQRIMNNE